MTTEHEAHERLLSLHEQHPYRRFAERWYRPKEARDLEAWDLAHPFACRLMADDTSAFDRRHGGLANRVRAIALFAYFLALTDPDLLNVNDALTDARVTAWVARLLRERKVSKAEVKNSYARQMRTQVLSLRENYPHLANRRELLGPMDTEHRTPVTDADFDIAMQHTETFRTNPIRRHTAAAILMARGAGVENNAMCWVRREHVYRGPGGALWLHVPAEANRPGDVPVSAPYADPLERLARTGDQRHLMVLDDEPPVHYERGSHVVSQLVHKMTRSGHRFEFNLGGLRAAWIQGHLADGVPLLSLFRASRLANVDALLRSITLYAAPGAATDVELAEHLGAVEGVGR